jgi:RNA polymerase sigma-70 factor (ECF subfamily)
MPEGSRTEVTDEALMAGYADGDAGAFDELFRRHEARAYAYLLKRTRSSERARDLYQELFLRIHRGRDAYDPSRGFLPWFFQIAHHLVIDDQRRAYRCYEVPIEDHVLPAGGSGCDEQLAHREALLRALGELSPEERYIVVSSKLEGVGYRELAVRLGKSVEAVKKAASRAMQRLRSASAPRPEPAVAGPG